MRIGIVGTGNMGRSLGILFHELGHSVFFGARDVSKAEHAALLTQGNAAFGSNAEAAEFGEVLIYTARGVNPVDVIGDVSRLEGKVLVDCNNSDVPQGFVFPAIETSLAEELQRQVPQAHVVKSFNTMSMEVFEHCPKQILEFGVANFIAGDNDLANQTVAELSQQLGFDTIVCGPLVRSRLLEGQADFIRMLMIAGVRSGAAFAIPKIPAASTQRLGGRESTRLGELK